MKNIINNLKYKLILLLVFGFNNLLFSQLEGDDTPLPDEGDGAPQAAIDMYLVHLAVVVILLLFYYHKKIVRLAKN